MTTLLELSVAQPTEYIFLQRKVLGQIVLLFDFRDLINFIFKYHFLCQKSVYHSEITIQLKILHTGYIEVIMQGKCGRNTETTFDIK